MRPRRKAAPRQGYDPSPVACRVERKDEIDHRQASAHQQCRLAGHCKLFDRSPRVGTPRIANESAADPAERPQGVRLLIADCKDQRLGIDLRSIVELEPPASVAPLAGHHASVHRLRTAAIDCLIEDPAEVRREEAPLRKSTPVAAFGLVSPREMVRIAGPGAHPLCPHVQKVRRFRRGIGNAPPHAAAPVDQL